MIRVGIKDYIFNTFSWFFKNKIKLRKEIKKKHLSKSQKPPQYQYPILFFRFGKLIKLLIPKKP